jgi:hypothetical protein
MKLTKRIIDAIPYPVSGQVFVRDHETRGFALRVTHGSKTFVLEKKIHGKKRRISIGRFGDLTVEQARNLARELIGKIASGGNPADERIAQRHAVDLPVFESSMPWPDQIPGVIYTYFIFSYESRLVKIGKSSDPRKRMDALQTSTGASLHFIGSINENIEAILHEKLAKYRVRGEWFTWNQEVSQCVNSYIRKLEASCT